MNLFDLFTISEKYLELLNPFTSEKIVAIGEYLGLNDESEVIEFGSGNGEVLSLWAKYFGIKGIGIDIREPACERARKKLEDKGQDSRIKIVCQNAAEYKFEKGAYDVAACIGATFIWDGYRNTIRKMKEAMKPGGKLAIGEPYWRSTGVSKELQEQVPFLSHEHELLKITREEGFDVMYVVRSSHDDWDRYEASNWYGLVKWIEENPEHPERQEVIDHLHKSQDKYFKYGREHIGWAVYILTPVSY